MFTVRNLAREKRELRAIWGLLAALAIVLAAAVMVGMSSMEETLTDAVQQNLDAADLGDLQVVVSGREAVVSGRLHPGVDPEDVVERVLTESGVRSVELQIPGMSEPGLTGANGDQ